MRSIRVLVIDASAFMRKMITEFLESNPEITVVGTARNGEQGIYQIKELDPDVVTLDVTMPEMNGLETLEKIMEQYPLPVVMIAHQSPDEVNLKDKAIQRGAMSFIPKPSGPISLDIHKIKNQIITQVIHAYENRSRILSTFSREILSNSMKDSNDQSLFVIGASTGGPRALQKILTQLPEKFTVPILIVQHMPKGFTEPLANRLNTLSAIHVKEAEDQESILENHAYIAPGGSHLEVKTTNGQLTMHLVEEPKSSIYRPSIDFLLKSLAKIHSLQKIIFILTGMGRDGSEGIKVMKQSNNKTIVFAESEATSIVYGMPKVAAKTGYVDEVIPLYEVPERMINLEKQMRRE